MGVLANALHLFNVAASLRSPVIAWSAGAMALTDRIVLFHDRSPQGSGQPEVYGSGLGVLRGVVPLPHARARLLLDDAPRLAVFARRFAPARCILLDNGTRVDTDSDGTCPPDTRVLAEDGRVTSIECSMTTVSSPAVSRKLAINRLRERGPIDSAVVDRFVARHEVPIVEGARCTFLYRGEVDEVRLIHQTFGLPAHIPLRRLPRHRPLVRSRRTTRGLTIRVPAGSSAR